MMEKPSDTLKVSTPSDREIRIVRELAAPRALVYETYTKPALLKRWLGVFNGFTLDVCEVDLRVGGAYRYVWRGPGGFEMGMGGIYKEIVPAERIVSTEKFDQSWYPGGAVGTVVFTEKHGRTTVTTDILYDTKEARDAVLKSPMDQGMEAGFQTLAALLATLQTESGVAA
jgi:uncharacterized protein YndB with AHSA1/START domain